MADPVAWAGPWPIHSVSRATGPITAWQATGPIAAQGYRANVAWQVKSLTHVAGLQGHPQRGRARAIPQRVAGVGPTHRRGGELQARPHAGGWAGANHSVQQGCW